MNKPLPVGLIASGRMNESLLTRFPLLTRELGPVVASSLRLASRYANALRAGRPADSRELGQCRLILIQTPVAELPSIVTLLLQAPVTWKSKVVALLDDDLDATALRPLRERRAAVGTVTQAPADERGRLLLEGDEAAVRLLSSWARQARLPCTALKPRAKALYGAGIMAAGTLLTPVLDCALHSLRAAGLTQVQARHLLGLVVEVAVRDQRACGRKSWLSPGAPARRSAVTSQLLALEREDPALAVFYRRSLVAALDYFGQDHDWL